ncbi:MAG: argininosuccinate synthase [Acidobacteriota bacterium]|nr:argininosuccinate synthase [Acidobacteriota bacterium]
MRIVLAFSGGLDTSFCVPWLQETKGAEVITAIVDTGGIPRSQLDAIARQARAVGAAEHHEIDARQAVWDGFVSTLIRGNVLRGEVYPLSVAAERTQQAMEVAALARRLGADAVAHGSTGAGNDQVRFDIVFRTLLPELPIIAPVRSLGLSREASQAYLRERGLPVPEGSGRYSVNQGLWGTTFGGEWTHDPWTPPPEDAFPPAGEAPAVGEVILGWEEGLPVTLNEEPLAGPDLVEALAALAAPYGIGRGIHIGETVLGIKGRIGFEAAAALILIAAHRELEKIVLTRWQAFWKDHLARFFGDRLHEGQALDPVMDDIRALIASSQKRVTGRTRVRLDRGHFQVVGVESPASLFDAGVARYGETHSLWTGEQAEAFAAIAAIPSRLAHGRARREGA